jgi:hypothetical protein
MGRSGLDEIGGACSTPEAMRTSEKKMVEKLEGNIVLGRPGVLLDDNIKVDHNSM